MMHFEGKEKLAYWMICWQKGLNLTSQLKYIIAALGFTDIIVSKRWEVAVGLFMIYFIATFILGMAWVQKMMTAEIEVGNKFNKFVHEMRRKIK
jgi:Tfp pilus assembly protein PilO